MDILSQKPRDATFWMDIHGPQRMHTTDFGDANTLFINKYLQNWWYIEQPQLFCTN